MNPQRPMFQAEAMVHLVVSSLPSSVVIDPIGISMNSSLHSFQKRGECTLYNCFFLLGYICSCVLLSHLHYITILPTCYLLHTFDSIRPAATPRIRTLRASGISLNAMHALPARNDGIFPDLFVAPLQVNWMASH